MYGVWSKRRQTKTTVRKTATRQHGSEVKVTICSVLLWNNHLPVRYRHRRSESTAYRLQARPAPTGPILRLTAMSRPNLPFNGLHLRNPCNFHGTLLIYRPWRDVRLSWPSWYTHSGRLTHEVITRQPWMRRRSDRRPNHWATPPNKVTRCRVNQNGDKASLGGKMCWWHVLWRHWPFHK